jgi:roadblock/LC7 domain-containing protein
MSTLDELMSLPGVYGAIEFSCMGELGEMRGDLERDFAELIAQMCADNMAIYRMQASGWTKLTGQQGFLPERGFAFLTLDNVVMGMNGKAILAHGKNFDYDAAYQRFNATV